MITVIMGVVIILAVFGAFMVFANCKSVDNRLKKSFYTENEKRAVKRYMLRYNLKNYAIYMIVVLLVFGTMALVLYSVM